MTNEEIDKFLGNKFEEERYVKISFKNREPIHGLFIRDNDFRELKAKNFWRIVTRKHFDDFKKSRDVKLAKIFNGSEFSKLSPLTETF
jgi:hypothetical protein